MRSLVACAVMSTALGFTTASWCGAAEREGRLLAAIDALRVPSMAAAAAGVASDACEPVRVETTQAAAPTARRSNDTAASTTSAAPVDESLLEASADALDEAEVLVTEAANAGAWRESHVQRFRVLVAQMVPEDASAAVQSLSTVLNAQRMRLDGPTPF